MDFRCCGSVDAICAQEKTVTGVVSDAGGTPGVNVVVKGPKIKTDFNGEVCNSSQSR
jgi:hypothetical protein